MQTFNCIPSEQFKTTFFKCTEQKKYEKKYHNGKKKVATFESLKLEMPDSSFWQKSPTFKACGDNFEQRTHVAKDFLC